MDGSVIAITPEERDQLNTIETERHSRLVAEALVEGIRKMMEAKPSIKGWAPVLDSYKREKQDRPTLAFIRPDGGETVELDVQDAELVKALDELRELTGKMAKVRETHDGLPTPQSLGDYSAWLMLLNYISASARLNRDGASEFSESLRQALVIHSFVNTTKSVVSGINFLAFLVNEIKGGQLVGKAATGLKIVTNAFKGAGIALGGAKVLFDIVEVALSEGPGRAEAATSMAFDGVSLGLDIAGTAIGGTVGGVLGVLSVPMFGVGLGLGALVGQWVGNQQDRAATTKFLLTMRDGYLKHGYALNAYETALLPQAGVVIEKLDLDKGTVTFGSNMMPQYDSNLKVCGEFDMHEGWGVGHVEKLLERSDVVVLPFMPRMTARLSTNLIASNGHSEDPVYDINGRKRDDGSTIQFHLRKNPVDLLSYQGIDYGWQDQNIEIVLGKKTVMLAMPDFDHLPSHRPPVFDYCGSNTYAINYVLTGGGGSYLLKPSTYGSVKLAGEASTWVIAGGSTPEMSISGDTLTINGTAISGIGQHRINVQTDDGRLLSLDQNTKQWNVVHLSAEWVEANKGNFPLALKNLNSQRPISIEMWGTKPGSCDALVQAINKQFLHANNAQILKGGERILELIRELERRLPEFHVNVERWPNWKYVINQLLGLAQAVRNAAMVGVEWNRSPMNSNVAQQIEQALNESKPSSATIGKQFKVEGQIVSSATFDPATGDIVFATPNGHLYQQVNGGQYKFIGIDMRHPSVDVADSARGLLDALGGPGPVKDPTLTGANEPIGTRLYNLAKAEGVDQFSVTTDEVSGVYISRGEKEPGSFVSVTSAGELFETAIHADTQKIVPEHFRGVSNEFISKCDPAKLFENLEAEAAKHELDEMIVQWKGPNGKMVQGYYKRDEKAVYVDADDRAILEPGVKLRFDHDLKQGIVVGLTEQWFTQHQGSLNEMVAYVKAHGNNGKFTVAGKAWGAEGGFLRGEYDPGTGLLVGTDESGRGWEINSDGIVLTGLTAQYFKSHPNANAGNFFAEIKQFPRSGKFTFKGLPMAPGAGEGKTIDGIYDIKSDRVIAIGSGGDAEGVIYVNPAVSKGGQFAFAGVSNEWAQHLQKPLGRSLYDLAVAKGVDHFTVAIGDITGVYTSHGENSPGLFQGANANGEMYEMAIHDDTSQIAPQFVGVNADFISKCQRDKVPLGKALYDLAKAKGVQDINVSTAEVSGVYNVRSPYGKGAFYIKDIKRGWVEFSTMVDANTSILVPKTGWPAQQVQLLSSPVPGRSELAMLSQAMSAFHRTEAAGSAGAMAPRNDEMLPTMASFAAHRPG